MHKKGRRKKGRGGGGGGGEERREIHMFRVSQVKTKFMKAFSFLLFLLTLYKENKSNANLPD